MKNFRDKVNALFFKPAHIEPAQQEQIKRLRQKKMEHFPFDFDRWYPALQEHSFNSQLIPILPEAATAMVNYYQQRYNQKPVFTKENAKELDKLEKIIQECLDVKFLSKENNEKQGGVFVRMSNRSPKDGAPLYDTQARRSMTLHQVLEKSETDSNTQMKKASELQLRQLFCEHAGHVMNLLLSSERVFQDLLLALDCQKFDPQDKWSTSVVLREWQHNLTEDMEFRVFVYNDQVTAISQYNPYCVFDSLISEHYLDKLHKNISDFVKSVHAKINRSEYIIDLAILDNHISIVELNPFAPSTGPCLFDWKRDDDILKPKQPITPVLKIRTEPYERASAIIQQLLAEEELALQENAVPYADFIAQAVSKDTSIRSNGIKNAN